VVVSPGVADLLDIADPGLGLGLGGGLEEVVEIEVANACTRSCGGTSLRCFLDDWSSLEPDAEFEVLAMESEDAVAGLSFNSVFEG